MYLTKFLKNLVLFYGFFFTYKIFKILIYFYIFLYIIAFLKIITYLIINKDLIIYPKNKIIDNLIYKFMLFKDKKKNASLILKLYFLSYLIIFVFNVSIRVLLLSIAFYNEIKFFIIKKEITKINFYLIIKNNIINETFNINDFLNKKYEYRLWKIKIIIKET